MLKKLFDRFLSKNSGADDRGNFRLKRILWTALSSIGSKAVTLLFTLISLPLTYNYLGEERYGLMATIISFIAMLGFADFGMGLGLHNRISDYETREDWEGLRSVVSSTFFMLLLIAGIFSLVFFVAFPFISWHEIFNLKSEIAIQEARPAMLVFFICFIISLPVSIVQKVQGGFQEGYRNEFWRAGGNILALILLVVAVELNLGVPWIILAVYGSQSLALVFNFLGQFFYKRKILSPKLSLVDFSVLRVIFKEGSIFFVLQFCAMLGNTSDSIIIAQILGSEAVAVFAVGYRLMLIFCMPIQAFAAPVLPAINDAFSKGDVNWVRQLFIKGLSAIGFISLFFGSILYFFGNFILKYWVGPEAILPTTLLIGFAFYLLYFNLNTLLSSMVLTPKFISFAIKTYPVAAIIALLGKIYLVDMFGIVGALWATIGAFTIFFFIPIFFFLRKKKLI